MAIPAFPTLTTYPSVELDEEYEDCRIKSKFENGTLHLRARYTKNRRKFTVRYDYLLTVDKLILEVFYVTDLQYGTLSFSWTHPISGTIYVVRIDEPVKFSYMLDTEDGYWKTELTLQEL